MNVRFDAATFALALLALGLAAACQTEASQSAEAGDAPASEAAAADTARIEEAFLTPRDTSDNVDSPAVWHGPDGQHWLLATAKQGDVIRVHDAATGEPVRRVGGSGTELGAFERPNGIAVVGDLMLIVERDNARLQVFSLPDFEPLGAFGQEHFRLPYGITAYEEAPGQYVAYVTDAYEMPDESIPPDSELGERVKQFRFSVENGELQHEFVRSFGDTSGAGVLRKVESLWADPSAGRLLIAEEQEGASQIKIYTLDGEFTGETIPTRYFPSEAEGIVLYACDGGAGYWITTDQGETGNTFHVFERRSLDYRGSFRGVEVTNTDGLALTQAGFGPFEAGAFYAVHNDGNTAAFAWADIAEALDLRADCAAR